MGRATFLGLVLAAVAVRAEEPKKVEPAADEKAVLAETNRERKAAGLEPLAIDETLTRAARDYAAMMAKAKELGHEVGGKGFAERFKATGFKASAGGENVAAGQKTAKDVVESWMKSEPHKKNLLGDQFTALGVGTAAAEDGTRYWVQIFAAPLKE